MRQIIFEEMGVIALLFALIFSLCSIPNYIFHDIRLIPSLYLSYATKIVSPQVAHSILSKNPESDLSKASKVSPPAILAKLVNTDVVQLKDGRFFVPGGLIQHNSNEAIRTVLASKDGNTILNGPTRHFKSYYCQAVLLLDGTVLIASGSKGVELFDPVLNRISVVGAMIIPRDFYTMTCLNNGRVLVSGGTVPKSKSDAGRSLTTLLEEYDPVSASFHPAGHLHQARMCPEVRALCDEQALIWGGETDEYIDIPTDYPVMPYELYRSSQDNK
ncbi:MAG: hypothetical protein P4L53_18410 [Candidatus Obscuribacterales bacterium]|nr:hypothetical protein [Candidatus Obscuribacterales bacterium]